MSDDDEVTYTPEELLVAVTLAAETARREVRALDDVWREKFFEVDTLARKRRKQLEAVRAICDRYHAEHWGWDEIRAVLDEEER